MQDANGDYTFGRSLGNFWVNSAAGVAQLIETTLRLGQGEWFLDQTAGTPYAQDILGTGKQSLYDQAIKAVVLGVQGVVSISNYASALVDRKLTVSMDVLTIYSETPVSVTTSANGIFG